MEISNIQQIYLICWNKPRCRLRLLSTRPAVTFLPQGINRFQPISTDWIKL